MTYSILATAVTNPLPAPRPRLFKDHVQSTSIAYHFMLFHHITAKLVSGVLFWTSEQQFHLQYGYSCCGFAPTPTSLPTGDLSLMMSGIALVKDSHDSWLDGVSWRRRGPEQGWAVGTGRLTLGGGTLGHAASFLGLATGPYPLVDSSSLHLQTGL